MSPNPQYTNMADVSAYSDAAESGMAVLSGVRPRKGARPPIDTSRMSVDACPWHKRPRVLYSIGVVVILFSVALTTVAVLFGTGIVDVSGGSNESAGATNQDDGGPPAPTNLGDYGGPPAPTNLGDSPAPSTSLSPSSSFEKDTSSPTEGPTQQATEVQRTGPFSFYVMGDIPYDDSEALVLTDQMGNMSLNLQPGATFMAHVGDMMKGQRTQCAEAYFLLVRNILSQGPLPAFVLAGDNDYLDCPDLDVAWSYYLNTFVNFELDWSSKLPTGVPPLNVTRWTEGVAGANFTTSRPEYFTFMEDGILFMSLNLMRMPDGVSPDDAFYERRNATKAWVTHVLSTNDAAQTRGVVMFGHAFFDDDTRPLFPELRAIFYAYNFYMPTLYVHGDGHQFHLGLYIGSQFGWDSFIEVQVEQGALADPLLITVAPLVNGVMTPLTQENGNQTIIANGLFRIDQQNGMYSTSGN